MIIKMCVAVEVFVLRKNRISFVLNFVLILLLLSGPFGVIPARAESSVVLEWAKSMGGVNSDNGISIAVDGSGNVYTTGLFYETVDFDPGVGSSNLTSSGIADIFISKLDSNGNFIWAKSMGGVSFDQGYDIAVDGSGNVYTTGFFQETVDFDPGAGTSNLASAGTNDIFISKLDSNGNFVWAKSIGGISLDQGYDIAVDSSGNTYTTGYFQETVDFDPGAGTSNLTSAGNNDIFISKLSSNGDFVWAKIMGGASVDISEAIAVDESGNVYTTGFFQATADFDPGVGTSNLTSIGNEDIFISKLDGSGNFVWAKSIGGVSFDNGTSIVVDGSGNVYTTGFFYEAVDFDPGVGISNLSSAGFNDIFISKLASSGNFIWAKNIGGVSNDSSYAIAIDGNSNVYTTGFFRETVDFDPGVDISNLTSAGETDIFISKLASSGNFVWAKSMEGISHASGISIAIDEGGNLYTTGFFHETVDFDPGPGTTNLTSVGDVDIFVSKVTDIPQVHYVRWDATGANNGTSWADAYTDLQSALSAASSGNEIWVAAGTYKPTSGTDRTISFTLKNGVAVYGGFAGTEASRDERNYEANPTILSGDIGIEGDNSDNSYHVVVSTNTESATLLDGFTITAGNANINMFSSDRGGGLYNDKGDPSLTNVIFSGNYAILGGGMFNDGEFGYPNGSNPILTNVAFIGNSAVQGGGLENINYSSPILTNVIFNGNTTVGASGAGMINLNYSSPTLTNVTFNGNSSSAYGGGLLNWNGSSPILINVTFHANSATNLGGGIYNDNGSNPSLTNVTISGNEALEGGGMYNAYGSEPTITNSIVYSNPGGEIFDVSGTRVVTYSIVQGGYPGTGNLDADPLLGPLQDNGGFTPTMALLASSAAIDTGDDADCPSTDQRGVTRPQGSHCDIGSFEFEPTFSNVDVNIAGNTQGDEIIIPFQTGQRHGFTVDNGPAQVVSTNGFDIIAALRVIWREPGLRTSYSEMMGLPVEQLSTEYWFPWYNNLDKASMDQGFRIANVDSSQHTIRVFLGSTQVGDDIILAGGGSIRVGYEVNNGPIRIACIDCVNPDDKIIAALRVIWKEPGLRYSYSEMMGLPKEQLSDKYWFPWYNNAAINSMDQGFRIANISSTEVNDIEVWVGSTKLDTISLAAGASIRKGYNVDNGPIRIFCATCTNTGDDKIIAALRVIWKEPGFRSSYSEMMGLPAEQLSTEYWFPWYNNHDTVSMDQGFRVANVDASQHTIRVFLGSTQVGDDIILAGGGSIRVGYDVNSGPIHIMCVDCSNPDDKIIVALRVIWQEPGVRTSYSEMMGLPSQALSTEYWFPWYNNATTSMDQGFRIAVP